MLILLFALFADVGSAEIRFDTDAYVTMVSTLLTNYHLDGSYIEEAVGGLRAEIAALKHDDTSDVVQNLSDCRKGILRSSLPDLMDSCFRKPSDCTDDNKKRCKLALKNTIRQLVLLPHFPSAHPEAVLQIESFRQEIARIFAIEFPNVESSIRDVNVSENFDLYLLHPQRGDTSPALKTPISESALAAVKAALNNAVREPMNVDFKLEPYKCENRAAELCQLVCMEFLKQTPEEYAYMMRTDRDPNPQDSAELARLLQVTTDYRLAVAEAEMLANQQRFEAQCQKSLEEAIAAGRGVESAKDKGAGEPVHGETRRHGAFIVLVNILMVTALVIAVMVRRNLGPKP